MLFLYSSIGSIFLVIFLQLVGINLHLFQYVDNGFSLITIQSCRNIDVVVGVMKDRCLRGISYVYHWPKTYIRKYYAISEEY